QPGQADGAQSSFYEPGGLSFAGGKLYVADTNNHAIRVVDVHTGETATLMLRNLRPPATSAAQLAEADKIAPNAEEIKLTTQRLQKTADNALVINVDLPAGYHLNEAAPQRARVAIESGAEHVAFTGGERTLTLKDVRLPLRVPLNARTAGAAELRLQLTLYYCRTDNTGTCRIKTLTFRAPVEVVTDANAPRAINLRGEIR